MMYQKQYDEISKIIDEQFFRLKPQEQELWFILQKSRPITKLENLLFKDKHSSIINFKTKNKNHRTYFSFEVLGKINEIPEILYKVNGSSFDSKQGKNIVYTIHNIKNNYLQGIYVDNYINIKNKVILNEVKYINTRTNTSRTDYVCLKFISSTNKTEEFIIDIESDIYRLYSSKQIDVTTLCNLALLQANNNNSKVEDSESLNFTKKLDKKFI